MGIMERKAKEKQIRKNDIIKAAEKIFIEKGFELATMDDIAKEAEFTKRTLYAYFKSKEELYYEIMLKGFKTLNSMCDEKLYETSGEAEGEKIKAIGKCFLDFRYKYPGYFKAILDYQNKDHDFHEDNKNTIIEQCYKEGEYALDIIKRCVAKGIEIGEFSSEINPEITVFTLWSYITGLIGLIDKKEKYIKYYYEKDLSKIVEGSFEIIVSSIRCARLP
ncbi:MAG: TetR/AcrR family transcriptional regulator [Bacillota bacterium]|nr:TetR/AcrR family transcriptional regulator [Bacillota bacterium]